MGRFHDMASTLDLRGDLRRFGSLSVSGRLPLYGSLGDVGCLPAIDSLLADGHLVPDGSLERDGCLRDYSALRLYGYFETMAALKRRGHLAVYDWLARPALHRDRRTYEVRALPYATGHRCLQMGVCGPMARRAS